MIKVSIIEVHSVQRNGLKSLLESDPSIIVVGAWSSLREACFQAADVLLWSYCAVCDLPSAQLVSTLVKDHCVVLYSGKETPISLLAYQGTDAQALLHQSASEKEVLSSIRDAASGAPGVEHRSTRNPLGLSQRETLVLTLVGEGYTNDQIARRIGISKHTVDTYLRRIRSKLNLGNKAQLARAAVHLAGAWSIGQGWSAKGTQQGFGTS